MIRNFFKTAWRNILKHKVYSLINFLGLTCGLAVALLIMSYVRHELSYDRFHERADRLYRLGYLVPNGLKLAVTPPPIVPLMKQFFPGVEEAARIYVRNVSISHPEGHPGESFEETEVLFADSLITKMFTFSFVSGSPSRALREPFTLLLNEEMAKKYFGDKDPVGESLILGGRHPFKIAGVVRNFPENAHLRFHVLVPYDNMYDLESDAGKEIMRRNLATNFIISHSYSYVLLKPGADPADVNRAMPDFLKKYCPPERFVGQKFELMPVPDIHVRSTLQGEPSSTNSMTNILIFLGIGILTILIACINYINLSTAQSFTRLKEIGIRKILGSAKRELILQFLAESFLFCAVSFALSYAIFYLALPLMNEFTNKHLVFTTLVDPPLMVTSAVLLVVITLLAGGYPAYFVSQFNSVLSLRGEGGIFNRSDVLRRVLVVFQLAIACMLLSGSLMLIKQLNYVNDRSLGFQKEHVLTIPLYSQNLNSIFDPADSSFRSRLQTFRNAVEAQSEVAGTTVSSSAPGLGAIYRGAIPEGFSQQDNMFVANLSVDYDFLTAFGMKMVAGRSFDRLHGTDEKQGFIVNESAVREFRWGTPEKAIGKTMNREGKKGSIIGVVSDFNMASLTLPVSALILEINPNQWSAISVKVTTDQVTPLTDKLRATWNGLFPEKTFEFSFLDEQLRQQYSDFRNFSKLIQSFTSIAVFISCLGVYGLVLFAVQRKVKEIGVRKVLGASVLNILRLICRDFAILIVIGFALGIPVSVYFIRQWLQNFTFHTNIDVLTYGISFLLICVVVAVTIGYHAMKAALANPVTSLRNE
jgi:putative ABC transport system permease protein